MPALRRSLGACEASEPFRQPESLFEGLGSRTAQIVEANPGPLPCLHVDATAVCPLLLAAWTVCKAFSTGALRTQDAVTAAGLAVGLAAAAATVPPREWQRSSTLTMASWGHFAVIAMATRLAPPQFS